MANNPYGIDDQTWQNLANQSGGWSTDDPRLNGYATTFQQLYQNMTGQQATPDQVTSFIKQAGTGLAAQPGDPTYGDISNLAQAFIQNTNPQGVLQQTQNTELGSLKSLMGQIPGLVNPAVSATASDLMNPNSPTYQKFSGMMNNLGITPSSGAFQSGLGGTLGASAAGDISSLMSSLTGPALGTAQGASSQPEINTLGQLYPSLGTLSTENMNNINFQEQSNLAKELAAMGQPSGIQTALGEAQAGTQAFHNLASLGGSGGGGGGTWVCTAMRKSGVLTQKEVDMLHNHLFKAKWKKPFKFLGYFIFGRFIVYLAESIGVNWEQWRPCFYDAVISEPDPKKAADLYERAFWELVNEIRWVKFHTISEVR